MDDPESQSGLAALSRTSDTLHLTLYLADFVYYTHSFYLSLVPLVNFFFIFKKLFQAGVQFSTGKARDSALSEVYPENVKAFPDIVDWKYQINQNPNTKYNHPNSRWFVANLRIFWDILFPGLKVRWRTKNDK